MERKEFPKANGYYEIRLESIGGLGANLCGKMLGELGAKYADLNSVSFSSYGSEKTGTPVKGFVRYCHKNKEIRVHSPVVVPDLLAIFHQALLQDQEVFKGCHEQTKVLLAVEEGQENGSSFSGEQKLPDRIKKYYIVPAQKIAIETHSRINMVMLGAVVKMLGFITLEDALQICTDSLGKKYPEALSGNLLGIKRGYAEVKEIVRDQPGHSEKKDSSDKKEKAWDYQTAPIGGINPHFGNSVINDVSPSRQGYIPVFIKERCINCGLCDSTCPDMVFQFKKGEYKGKEMMVNQGLDYYHCKGCLRCVDVCPVNALVRGVEAEHPEKDYFMPNQDLLRVPDYYQKSGADGYITSESYLTEKRMEGGEI